jgi:tRNA(Ile)-lysidine synthase
VAEPDVLTAAEFGTLLDRLIDFAPGSRLAVAVSGGADSLALALVAADWARERGHSLTALTVDHGLRAESAAEAAIVAGWLADAGIPHEILRWDGAKPAANRQAAARAARYRLMLDWAWQHRALAILLGHHQQDQGETVLLRLARGSGVDGRAAMAPRLDIGGVALLRPLLDQPRARMRATLAARDQAWIEDESNRDTRYARAAMREAAAGLSALGLGAERLAATAARLARARAALDFATDQLLDAAATFPPDGHAAIVTRLAQAVPHEIGLRALRDILRWVGADPYPPRLARLEAAFDAWMTGEKVDRTLAGCRMRLSGDRLLVAREPSAIAPPIPLNPAESVVWDGRFRVTTSAELPSGTAVGAVGTGAPAAVKAMLSALPAIARPVVPALFVGGTAVALPTVNPCREVAVAPIWADAGIARRNAYHDIATARLALM